MARPCIGDSRADYCQARTDGQRGVAERQVRLPPQKQERSEVTIVGRWHTVGLRRLLTCIFSVAAAVILCFSLVLGALSDILAGVKRVLTLPLLATKELLGDA